jgi:hypothetical protein
MGRWSPECYRCEWTDGAAGPAVGARFKAWNRRWILRWSNKPTVVAASRGAEFAFARTTRGAGEVVWRYRFEPTAIGTLATESYEATRDANPVVIWIVMRLMRVDDRKADLEQGMRSTLERIKTAAEAG